MLNRVGLACGGIEPAFKMFWHFLMIWVMITHLKGTILYSLKPILSSDTDFIAEDGGRRYDFVLLGIYSLRIFKFYSVNCSRFLFFLLEIE